jgi:hypothetical protein
MISIIEKEKMHILESGGGESEVDQSGRGHGMHCGGACGGHHQGKVTFVAGREAGRRHASDTVFRRILRPRR